MIEVAATLGTFNAYARRDRACWQSAAQQTRALSQSSNLSCAAARSRTIPFSLTPARRGLLQWATKEASRAASILRPPVSFCPTMHRHGCTCQINPFCRELVPFRYQPRTPVIHSIFTRNEAFPGVLETTSRSQLLGRRVTVCGPTGNLARQRRPGSAGSWRLR